MRLNVKNLRISLIMILSICLMVLVNGTQMLVVVFTCALLFLCKSIHNGKINIYKKATIMFLFPLGIFFANNTGSSHFVRPLLTFLMLTLIVCCSTFLYQINYMYLINSIRKLGIVVSISVVIEKIIPSLFVNGIYQLFNPELRETLINQITSENYYSGFFPQPAAAATFIVFSIFIVCIEEKKIHYELIIMIIGLLLTGKRSHVIFGLVAILIVAVVKSNDRQKFKKILNAIMIVGLCFIGGYVAISVLPLDGMGALGRLLLAIKEILSSSSETTLDFATAGRYSTYLEAWGYFKNNPLRGIGWNKFSAINYNTYLGSNLSNVHNIYLQLLCDSGIIGFVCCMIMFFYILTYSIKITKKWNDDYVCVFALTVQIFFMLYGLTETSFDSPFLYISYYLAVIMIFCRNKYNEMSQGKVGQVQYRE